MRLFLKYSLLLSFSVFLSACFMAPRSPTAMMEIKKTLQTSKRERALVDRNARERAALKKAVLSDWGRGGSKHASRFDVDVQEVPLRSFLSGLARGTPYNILVKPEVRGSVTLKLSQVTLPEVMEALSDTYDWSISRTTYGFTIGPKQLQTRVFRVNYPDLKRKGHSQTQLSSTQISDRVAGTNPGGGPQDGGGLMPPGPAGPAGPAGLGAQNTASGSLVETHSESDFWQELKEQLSSMVGQGSGRKVSIHPSSGLVTVRAYPRELAWVSEYLDRAMGVADRQVILEAKILEVRLNDAFQSGIDWSVAGLGQHGASDLTQPFFSINVTGGFQTLIHLLEEQGNVQVLSSPRIATLNNQKAVIKVGSDQFFVTSVMTNNTPTGNSSTLSQSVGLTPFFAGITLDVTPQISQNNKVILHIHPAISEVKDQTKTINLGQNNILQLPLANSNIRESDSVVEARDGQVIVLGGLMQNKTEEQLKGAAPASKIPFLGSFFRNTTQQSSKSELVILLKTTILNKKKYQQDIHETEERFKSLDRGFHVGSRPSVFGTLGENQESEA